MTLYVICGHGAGDSGAVGNGYQEQERVRALGARMAALGGSNVYLCDTSRNWYADNGISTADFGKGNAIIELHLDSAVASARGGHVIIQSGIGGADDYDNALAAFLKSYFPGRSSIIVERNDLANPARAAARGINYRLVEVCFISNAVDMAKFNANINAVAKGLLAAFGIGASDPEPQHTNIILWAEGKNVSGQRWRTYAPDLNDTYQDIVGHRLVNLVTGGVMKPLSVEEGSPIVLAPSTGDKSEIWYALPFKHEGAANTVVLANGANPELVIAFASANQGEKAVLWSRNNLPGQVINMQYFGADQFTYKDVLSGLLLVPNMPDQG